MDSAWVIAFVRNLFRDKSVRKKGREEEKESAEYIPFIISENKFMPVLFICLFGVFVGCGCVAKGTKIC